MKRIKSIAATSLVLVWMASVHAQTTQQSLTPAAAVSQSYTVFDSDGFPQPARRAFESGADGTPLPPQNPDASKYWPPEFKKFLDAALALFKRGGKEPKIAEVEKALNVRLTPELKINSESGVLRDFRVHGVHFGPPEPMKRGHYLAVLGSAREPNVSWQMTILVDAERYCVSPYEIAIYLGESFSEIDRRVHVERRDGWPPSYTWGMFKRGSQGVHTSQPVWITTPQQVFNQPHRDPGCILSLKVFGEFIKD